MVLGPDKGNGVEVIDIHNYKLSKQQLFSDRSLRKKGEITEADYNVMYPNNAKTGHAYGFAKVNKEFERLPNCTQ